MATSGRTVSDITSMEVDSFWSSKHKQELWRLNIFFGEGHTPKLSFFSTREKALSSMQKHWSRIESIEKEAKEANDS